MVVWGKWTNKMASGAIGTNRSDFMKRLKATLKIAEKLKIIMKKKNIRACRCVCPDCKKYIHAKLYGPKDHIHMYCETVTCHRLME